MLILYWLLLVDVVFILLGGCNLRHEYLSKAKLTSFSKC